MCCQSMRITSKEVTTNLYKNEWSHGLVLQKLLFFLFDGTVFMVYFRRHAETTQ